MGFSYIKKKGKTVNGIVEFSCDTEADVALLPRNGNIAAAGSKATVIQTGNKYILNSKREWVRCGNGGSSGGSGEMLIPVYTEVDNVYTCDTSLADILESVRNGTCVCAKFERCYYVLDIVNEDYVRFSFVEVSDKGTYYDSIIHEIDKDDGEEIRFVETIFNGNKFVATYTVTESEGVISATCDKNYSDIVSAIEDGKQIICKIRGIFVAQTDNYLYANDDHNLVFTLAVSGGNGSVAGCYAIVHPSVGQIFVITPS